MMHYLMAVQRQALHYFNEMKNQLNIVKQTFNASLQMNFTSNTEAISDCCRFSRDTTLLSDSGLTGECAGLLFPVAGVSRWSSVEAAV